MSLSIKPTGIPNWADGASAFCTDPGVAKRSIGWSGAEKPAADSFNFLQREYGRHLRYLSYDWVLQDDFCHATLYDGFGLTGFNPQWELTPSGLVNNSTWQGVFHSHEDGMPGVVQVRVDGNSGLSYIRSVTDHQPTGYAGGPLGVNMSPDWIFESKVRVQNRPSGATHGFMRIGPTDECFVCTGNLPTWQFTYTPTGSVSPTFIGLGITMPSGTYQTLRYERIGDTGAIEIDGQQVGTVAGRPAGQAMTLTGVVVQKFGGAVVRVWVDNIRLGIRR